MEDDTELQRVGTSDPQVAGGRPRRGQDTLHRCIASVGLAETYPLA